MKYVKQYNNNHEALRRYKILCARFCEENSMIDLMARLFTNLYPELVLVNSHDGLSSYHLIAGVFRLTRSNGLVAGHS